MKLQEIEYVGLKESDESIAVETICPHTRLIFPTPNAPFLCIAASQMADLLSTV